MATTKLWVEYQTPAKTFLDKVSIQGCEDVADFLNRLYERPLLSIPSNTPITLYQPDGSTEIDVGESPADYLQGNSRKSPLIVKITAVGKSSRQASTRKMAVEASCRKYLDAMARQISGFYDFDYNPRYGATMGNVLAAKDGKEGQDWWFRLAKKTFADIDTNGFKREVKKGQKLATCALPELFEPDEWAKISNFNNITSERIHSGELPRLSDGRAYIIIPSHMYSAETVAFLQDIGVRGFLLSDPGALVVKNEDTLSESSFMG